VKKVSAIVLVVFIILFIVFLMLKKTKTQKSTPKLEISPIPTTTPKISRGEIIIGKEPEEYTVVNSLVNLFVTAKSSENIVGFDISLNYDKKYLKFIKVENLAVSQFDIFSTTKDNLLIISGIKKLSYQDKISFKNDQILKLQFQAIKKGKTKLVPVRHNNSISESNLITENSLDILDKVSGPTVYIDEVLNLKKDKTVVFNKDISLTLTDFSVADVNCRDCLTFAEISVNNKKEKKDLFFKTGGFAGYLITRLTFGNYIFLLKEVKTDSVDLIIYEI